MYRASNLSLLIFTVREKIIDACLKNNGLYILLSCDCQPINVCKTDDITVVHQRTPSTLNRFPRCSELNLLCLSYWLAERLRFGQSWSDALLRARCHKLSHWETWVEGCPQTLFRFLFSDQRWTDRTNFLWWRVRGAGVVSRWVGCWDLVLESTEEMRTIVPFKMYGIRYSGTVLC